MFFHDKITSIKPTDRVLEIGPGGTPHSRADVFLDLDPKLYKNSDEAAWQRGKAAPLQTEKPVIYYDGKRFPFKTGEFDYIIATHVLEHVPDVDQFLAEVFRVGKMGYIEYPTIYYDYVYDIPVHVNFLKKHGDTIYWMKKSESGIMKFQPVQFLFQQSSTMGYTDLIDDLVDYMMEGFEWRNPLKNKHTKSIDELVWKKVSIKPKSEQSEIHTLRQHLGETAKFYATKLKIKGKSK